jgi:hypothetical protein
MQFRCAGDARISPVRLLVSKYACAASSVSKRMPFNGFFLVADAGFDFAFLVVVVAGFQVSIDGRA